MTPIEMPVSGASLQSFEPQRVDYLSPEAGGRIGAVAAGNALWSATWQIGKVGQAKSDAWRAFVARQRGSGRLFFGRDLARPRPLAHPENWAGLTLPGGAPFGGLPTDWSQEIDEEGDALLTLSGVATQLVLSLGDYVGFRWGPTTDIRRTIVRVVIGGAAASNGTITVAVEPPVPTLVVPEAATTTLNRPACHMRLVPGSVDLGPIDRRLAITSGKISAIQDLR